MLFQLQLFILTVSKKCVGKVIRVDFFQDLKVNSQDGHPYVHDTTREGKD